MSEAAFLSALKAASSATTSLANNISNGETIGYKKERAVFTTLVAGSSNPNIFAAGGVRASPLRIIEEQGLLEATTNVTDMSIIGNGFFVVSKSDTASGATTDFAFTRAGEWIPDANGNLKNPGNGNYLYGWATDQLGVPTAAVTNVLSSLVPVNISKVANIVSPTSQMALKINLPEGDAVTDTHTSNIEVFDSLGAPHTLNLLWTKTVLDPQTWTLDVTSPDAVFVNRTDAFSGPYTAMTIVFDGNGQPVSFDGVATPPPIFIDWANSASDSTISLNLGTVGTSTGLTARSGEFEETKIDQDGKALGKFSGVAVDENGIITALYSNGEALRIFKVPLVNFPSPHALGAKDGGVFIQTDQSGKYLLGAANTSGLGSIRSSTVEKSTVSLADELTKMLQIQRYYTVNTKGIKILDEMFIDLKNIKQ